MLVVQGSGAVSHIPWGGGNVAGRWHSKGSRGSRQVASSVAVLAVPAAAFELAGGCQGVLTKASLTAEFHAWISKPPCDPLSSSVHSM